MRMEEISRVLDLNKIGDRLTLLVAAFNIWRLMAGYVETGALPVPDLPVGMTVKFVGCRVEIMPCKPGAYLQSCGARSLSNSI